MTAIALVTVCTLWILAGLFSLFDASIPEQVARQILSLPTDQPLPVATWA